MLAAKIIKNLFPKPLVITDFSIIDQRIFIKLLSSKRSAYCPRCGFRSRSMQSMYSRTLLDLPMLNYSVALQIQAKRFWCKQRSCPQRIFSATLNSLADKYARSTKRRDDVLTTLGVFLVEGLLHVRPHPLGYQRVAQRPCESFVQ